MTKTLAGQFAIDRLEVPTFYTPTVATVHDGILPGIRVFAESSDHFMEGYITLGYVSAQTPLGQGTFLGFKHEQVREADPFAVIANLRRTHPHGRSFRPHCTEAQNADFHLMMSGAVRNWTNDDTGGVGPIHDVSRGEIERYAQDARRQYRKIMRRWKRVTRQQIKLIFADVESQ